MRCSDLTTLLGALILGASASLSAAETSAPATRLSLMAEAKFGDPTVQPGPYQNVWGIFIGVGQYRNPAIPDLPNPPNDARELAQAFVERAGVTKPAVLIDEQATVPNLRRILHHIARESTPGDLLVFHFSGHGIGFEQRREALGLLLFHDTPDLQRVLSGDLSQGVLDMSAVNRLMDQAGIRAKHKIFFFDCCFGGIATLPPGTRSIMDDPTSVVDRMMKSRALFILSAGSYRQAVSDGPPEEGHGLLSGYILKVLRKPSDFKLDPVEYHGRHYYSMLDVYSKGLVNIPIAAETHLKRVFGIDEPSQRKVNERNGLPPAQQQQLQEYLEKVQVPQQARQLGEGWPYLPLFPQEIPQANVQQVVVNAPPPEPKPRPVDTELLAAIEDWSARTGEKYNSPEYANALKDVLTILAKDSPPRLEDAPPIVAEAQLLARPQFNFITSLLRAQNIEYDESGLGQVDLLRQREQWRNQIDGAQWRTLPFNDGRADEVEEYAMVLANHGSQPLNYYIIALDEAGILQWIAPSNDTWGNGFGFGTPVLAPGAELTIPGTIEVDGQQILFGMPAQGDLDQRFMTVFTQQPWPALEAALTKASSLSAQVYNANPAQVKNPVGTRLAKPSVAVRALGAAQFTPGTGTTEKSGAAAEAPTSTPANIPAATSAATSGPFMQMTWSVAVLPVDEIEASLVAETN